MSKFATSTSKLSGMSPGRQETSISVIICDIMPPDIFIPTQDSSFINLTGTLTAIFLFLSTARKSI